MNFHDENYDLIVKVHFGAGKKQFLNDANGICRFCKKSEPDVSFSNISHAIPEFLGNRYLTSKNECDSCNKWISENIENHFDKLTKPIRSVCFKKGKNSIPKHVQGAAGSRLRLSPSMTPSGPFLEIISNSDECIDIDLSLGTIDIPAQIEPFVPLAIYKFFIKIAISLLPFDLVNELDWSRRLLMREDLSAKGPDGIKIFITKFTRPNILSSGFCYILKKKPKSKVPNPEYIVLLNVGNIIYQAPIFSDQSQVFHGGIEIQMMHYFYDKNHLGIFTFDEIEVSSPDLEKGRVDIVRFQFENIDQVT